LDIISELKADAVITDPPYGISYCHGARKGGVKMGTDCQSIIGDDSPFDPSPWLGYPVIVLWGANHYASRLPDSSRWLIWDKREGIPPNDQADAEVAWTNNDGVIRLKSRYWNGAQAKEKNETRTHSNQKPVALMEWCMKVVEVPGNAIVLDPYMGSGTTGIACIRTNRNFIGVEKDKGYFDIACERIERELSQGVLF
jgi:site-specific DNA-methyltransferase (adenine-specific)/modification methylase